VPLLSDVVVPILSSIALLNPNGYCLIVLLLHSVSNMAHSRYVRTFWCSFSLRRRKGAHTHTSLARESASGSLTRKPGSDIYYIYLYIFHRLVTLHTRTCLTHWNPSPAGLASQTRTCMGTLTLNYSRYFLSHKYSRGVLYAPSLKRLFMCTL
jgi:hypothetical protein